MSRQHTLRTSGKMNINCALKLHPMQNSMPALCEVWLPIPKLLALLYIQQSCFCVKRHGCEENGFFIGICFPMNHMIIQQIYFAMLSGLPCGGAIDKLMSPGPGCCCAHRRFLNDQCAHRVSFVLRVWGACHKFGATKCNKHIPWNSWGLLLGFRFFLRHTNERFDAQTVVVSDSFKHKFMTRVFPSLSSIEMACRILYHVLFPIENMMFVLRCTLLTLVFTWRNKTLTSWFNMANKLSSSVGTLRLCGRCGHVVLHRPATTSSGHELGQISYIFSDKTGTLTQNVMELKRHFLREVCWKREAHHDRSPYLMPPIQQC